MRPGEKGTVTGWPACFAACSTPRAPCQHDEVGQRDLLAARLCLVELALDALQRGRTFASSAGWLASQSFCGARRMRAPLAPPRLSDPRNVEADAHAVDTSCGMVNPDASTVALSAATSCASISGWSTGGIGSCQRSSSFGTSGPR